MHPPGASLPLSKRVAIGATTAAGRRTADTSTTTGTATPRSAADPGITTADGPASSAAAVDHCGRCPGLHGRVRQVRPSFHPGRSAVGGTTMDGLPGGVLPDATHLPCLRLPGSLPPVTRRSA
ncbi:hypothetical protein ACVB8X_01480 [Streptomyces sp. NRAIS4]